MMKRTFPPLVLLVISTSSLCSFAHSAGRKDESHASEQIKKCAALLSKKELVDKAKSRLSALWVDGAEVSVISKNKTRYIEIRVGANDDIASLKKSMESIEGIPVVFIEKQQPKVLNGLEFSEPRYGISRQILKDVRSQLNVLWIENALIQPKKNQGKVVIEIAVYGTHEIEIIRKALPQIQGIAIEPIVFGFQTKPENTKLDAAVVEVKSLLSVKYIDGARVKRVKERNGSSHIEAILPENFDHEIDALRLEIKSAQGIPVIFTSVSEVEVSMASLLKASRAVDALHASAKEVRSIERKGKLFIEVIVEGDWDYKNASELKEIDGYKVIVTRSSQ